MGIPTGDDNSSTSMQTTDDDSSTLVTIVFYNMCRYPSPPNKFEMKFPPTETLGSIRQKLSEKLDYKPDTFDLLVRGKKVQEDDKTLNDWNLNGTQKGMINISRKSTAKVTSLTPPAIG